MKTLLAAVLALSFLGGCGGGHDHGTAPAASPQAQVQDPVCGMMVEKASARSQEHQGKTWHFCSQECLDKFKAAPEKYVK